MFKLYFATPDKKVVADALLEEVTLPAAKGELNILPGHAPLMTTLSAGILSYKLKNGESKKVAISWGYCQVSADGVTVLAETGLEANEIDTKVVQQHLTENEARLSTESLSDADWEQVQNEIAKLRAELALTSENKTH